MKVEAKERLYSASRPLFMTGSGISAESGVPTFRGEDGLWKGANPQELATPGAFNKDPWHVWQWYDWRRSIIAKVSPSAAHLAMALFRQDAGGVPVITQNVDGLHQMAGSTDVFELHGSIWRLRCVSCALEGEDRVTGISGPPICTCGGMQRPGVVWFGEALPEDVLRRSMELAGAADVVLVVGTSGVVQPAASLVGMAKEAGAFIVEVNPDSTPLTSLADISFRAGAGDVVPELLA